MTTNREWLYSLDVADLSDWFDAEHVDDLGQIADMSQKSADCVRNDGKMSETGVRATDVDANDENATCNSSDDFVTDDSREKLEAAAQTAAGYIYGRGFTNGLADAWNVDEVDTAANRIIQLLDRQAEITRRTEQAEWIKQANGLIREANARADELQAKVDELAELNDYHSLQYDLAYEDAERLQAQVDNLTAERDELREKLSAAIGHAVDILALQDLTAVDMEGETKS